MWTQLCSVTGVSLPPGRSCSVQTQGRRSPAQDAAVGRLTPPRSTSPTLADCSVTRGDFETTHLLCEAKPEREQKGPGRVAEIPSVSVWRGVGDLGITPRWFSFTSPEASPCFARSANKSTARPCLVVSGKRVRSRISRLC